MEAPLWVVDARSSPALNQHRFVLTASAPWLCASSVHIARVAVVTAR